MAYCRVIVDLISSCTILYVVFPLFQIIFHCLLLGAGKTQDKSRLQFYISANVSVFSNATPWI